LGRQLGASTIYPSTEERVAGAADSEWVIVAKRDQDLAALDTDLRWVRFDAAQETWTWTDDFSNVLSLPPPTELDPEAALDALHKMMVQGARDPDFEVALYRALLKLS